MKLGFSFLIVFLLLGCGLNKTKYYFELENIDSLLQKKLYSDAHSKLINIQIHNLDRGEISYYYLLEAELAHGIRRQYKEDHIKKSLDYYAQNKQSEKFVRTALCKANLLLDRGIMDSATYYSKVAEYYSKKNGYKTLLLPSLRLLAYINLQTDNYRMSIEYGNQLKELSKSMNNSQNLGYAYDNNALAYYRMGLKDSFCVNVQNMLPYIEGQPNNELPYYYKDIAVYSHISGRHAEEEAYLLKALDADPLPMIYSYLANFYVNQGRMNDAEKLWKSAFETDDLHDKIDVMTFYAQWLDRLGRKDEYGFINHRLIQLKDSLAKFQQTDNLQGLQNAFDRNRQNEEWNTNRSRSIGFGFIAFVFLILSMLVRFFILSRRQHRLSEEIDDKEKDMKSYEDLLIQNDLLLKQKEQIMIEQKKQVETLKKRQEFSDREIEKLKTKVDDLRDQQAEIIAEGHDRYEHILKNGKTTLWKKYDYMVFLEYYGIVNHDFITSVNHHYTGLTYMNKFYLAIRDMGKTEEEAASIMCLSPNALRMMHSRINKRRIGC